VANANVLLHVRDASSPFVAEAAEDVVKVLGDLAVDAETRTARILYILNKADLLTAGDEQVTSLQNMFSDVVFVSAKTGDGVDDLLAHFDRHHGKLAILAIIYITPIDGVAHACLHQNAMVKSSLFDDHGHEQVLVSIDPADHERLCARWPDLCVLRVEA
jgi:GTPase